MLQMIHETGMRIPQEVFRFFTNPGGHSLILRGNAGAGKTTFALQIIEDLAAVEKSYYFPTRVSDANPYATVPWLKEKMDLFLQANGRPGALPEEVACPETGPSKLKGLSAEQASNGKNQMVGQHRQGRERDRGPYKRVESRLPERTC